MVDVVGLFVFRLCLILPESDALNILLDKYLHRLLSVVPAQFAFFHRIQRLKLELANTWFPSHISVNRYGKIWFLWRHTHTRCSLSQWTRMLAKKEKQKIKRECAKKRGALTKKSIDHKIWAGYFFFISCIFLFLLCSEFWVSTKITYRIYENHGKGYMRNKRHVY